MIANFLIDSRHGGPHLYLESLKNNIYQFKSIDFYQDKFVNDLKLSDLKTTYKYFFFIDVIINIYKIIFYFQKTKKINTFCVFTIYNIAPIISGLILNKKINWFILEKPDKFSLLIFKILNFFFKFKVIVISKSLARFLNIKKYELYFPDINFKFWNKNKNSRVINSKKKIYLTCTCNINKTKNHLQLLNLIENINFKIEINIIGRKLSSQLKYYKLLKKKITNLNQTKNLKINLLGKKNKRFIRSFYQKTHIYVLPSLSEGLSVSLTEAMSAGCICLVSKNSNHSKVINTNNGFEFDLNKDSFENQLNKITNLKKKQIFKIKNNGYKTIKNLISKSHKMKLKL